MGPLREKKQTLWTITWKKAVRGEVFLNKNKIDHLVMLGMTGNNESFIYLFHESNFCRSLSNVSFKQYIDERIGCNHSPAAALLQYSYYS